MLKVGRIADIIEDLKTSGDIICFGAGKRIELMKKIFDNTCILERISFFVDNDVCKHGTEIPVKNRMVRVISFPDLKKKKSDPYIILVIPEKYQDILKQVNEDPDTKDHICYCMSYLIALMEEDSAMEKKVPDSFKRFQKELIPRTLHYCWFGKRPLPDRYKKWMASWNRYCPDYEIIEWNESNYDITKSKYMKQAYEKEKWGFVSDIARLDIIYHYGGIYLDTDVELVNNLDDLLYQEGFAGFESNEYVNLGLGFGAAKGLSVMKEMLDAGENMEFYDKQGRLNMLTCPVWQTRLLKQKGLLTNGEYQIIEGLTILPEKVLSGKSFSTRRIRLAPYTKAIHHYDGSWLNEEQRREFLNLEEVMNRKRE